MQAGYIQSDIWKGFVSKVWLKMKHQYRNHLNEDENCEGCCICEGGLLLCKICGLAEGELTTDCPNEPINYEKAREIYNGQLDYVDGKWIHTHGRKLWKLN